MAAYDDNAPIQLLRLSLHLCEMDTAVDNTIRQEDESPVDFVVIDGEPKTSAWVVAFHDVVFLSYCQFSVPIEISLPFTTLLPVPENQPGRAANSEKRYTFISS